MNPVITCRDISTQENKWVSEALKLRHGLSCQEDLNSKNKVSAFKVGRGYGVSTCESDYVTSEYSL